MAEKSSETTVHSVTLQFTGTLAGKMADQFVADWLDGGLHEVWEERLDDADIAESINSEWDAQSRTLVIEGIADDEDGDDKDEDGDGEEEEGEDDDRPQASLDDEDSAEDRAAAAIVEGAREHEET